MMDWIRKILGITRPEKITAELIELLPAHRLCRKYINGELACDMENEVFNRIMCVVELHTEVFNGGFNQYYYNSGGERAKCAEDTFAQLGAVQVADVVKRANEQYAAKHDWLHAVWDGTLEGFENYENKEN